MSHLFAEYGLFLLKTVTIVLAIIVVISFAAAAGRRATQDNLEVEHLNRRYRSLGRVLKKAVLGRSERRKEGRAARKRDRREEKASSTRPRSFVLDFKGDLRARAVASLREEISAVLDVARDGDEVILRLENHGGMVHEHGLATSQLARIRDRDLPLIVCVDKVAASGGYLMACVATKIVAAPFAILGSIGVLAQIPNFNRLLDNHGVEVEQIMAGRYKRTVTMFGENTDEDREKLKSELEDVHQLFKAAVAAYRPGLDLEELATGEHWYGTRALELGLADALTTSDELLTERAAERDLYRVSYRIRQRLQQRLMASADGVLERLDSAAFASRFESRLPR